VRMSSNTGQSTTSEPKSNSYRYDLPEGFRNQFLFIMKEAFGFSKSPYQSSIHLSDTDGVRAFAIYNIYSQICTEFCESEGLLNLPGITLPTTPLQALWSFFLSANKEQALRIIEIAIRSIPVAQNNVEFALYVYPTISADEAIAKLNQRFLENAIGYRMENGKIIRIDSEFLHAETIDPALRLLHAMGYKGALDEFQLALDHYRHQHYDDCITNCLKALESTLQKIIELRKWEMPGKSKFDNLFAEVKKKGLFPPFLGSHLGELEKFLQAIAVIRNEEGGHGSGALPNEVPDHLVAYQIHLTGSAIVFLIRCNENYCTTKQ
jgi:hypothetical protein